MELSCRPSIPYLKYLDQMCSDFSLGILESICALLIYLEDGAQVYV